MRLLIGLCFCFYSLHAEAIPRFRTDANRPVNCARNSLSFAMALATVSQTSPSIFFTLEIKRVVRLGYLSKFT
ncbi:hypothetical protein BH11VER1_BH11VER1_19700 [soil metagenome]